MQRTFHDAPRRLVHLCEGSLSPRHAKTTRGVIMYSRHPSVGIIDSTSAGRTSQDCLGVGGAIPVGTSIEQFPQGDTLVIGITPVGGGLPPAFRAHIRAALKKGWHLWNGMHDFLRDDPEFSPLAHKTGAVIWDARRAPTSLPVGAGRCRSARSYICLFVGTDCSIGKMTAALEMQRQLPAPLKSEFVATGQTGMMISGWGHPIDAIPGDFMAGCVESDCLSVDGKTDVIWVEGQGALQHPGFSSVTLALLHGACPDGIILCHQPSRLEISKLQGLPIPSLPEVAAQYLELARLIKPTRLLGVCLNTYGMPESDARAAIDAAAKACGVPAADPVRFDGAAVLEAVLAHARVIGKIAPSEPLHPAGRVN